MYQRLYPVSYTHLDVYKRQGFALNPLQPYTPDLSVAETSGQNVLDPELVLSLIHIFGEGTPQQVTDYVTEHFQALKICGHRSILAFALSVQH